MTDSTEADTLDELRANVRAAVQCHFEEGKAPDTVLLDMDVRQAVMSGLADLAWPTWPGRPGLADLAWPTWPGRPGLADLAWPTWPGRPGLADSDTGRTVPGAEVRARFGLPQ